MQETEDTAFLLRHRRWELMERRGWTQLMGALNRLKKLANWHKLYNVNATLRLAAYTPDVTTSTRPTLQSPQMFTTFTEAGVSVFFMGYFIRQYLVLISVLYCTFYQAKPQCRNVFRKPVHFQEISVCWYCVEIISNGCLTLQNI